MAEFNALVTNNGAPVTAPADDPEFTVRRTDTGAIVAGPSAASHIGDGVWRGTWTTVAGAILEYSVFLDADPNATGQVTASERYQVGSFSSNPELLRKLLANRAVTTINAGPAPPANSRTIDFYDDDGTTVVESLLISTDGLERTNP